LFIRQIADPRQRTAGTGKGRVDGQRARVQEGVWRARKKVDIRHITSAKDDIP
jgi:hypothetical protein